MTEAVAIREHLPAFRDSGTSVMASPASATPRFSELDLTVLDNLPARIGDRTLARLDEIANCPLPALPASDERHFAKCMRILSVLPRRADDEVTGEVRFRLYHRHFGALPADALSFLAERASHECRFFPTPSECQAILDRWERADEAVAARRFAANRARAERELRWTEVMERLKARTMDQAEIDGLSDRAKRVAEERGFVRALRDGSFTAWPDVNTLSEAERETHRAKVQQMLEDGLL